MTGLSRRQFVLGAGAAGLGLLAGCGRLPWQAQPPAKVPRIGLLLQDDVGVLGVAARGGQGRAAGAQQNEGEGQGSHARTSRDMARKWPVTSRAASSHDISR